MILYINVLVNANLHPERDVVHFERGVRVVQVHFQAGGLGGDGRQGGGVVGRGAHIQSVVTAAARFGQLVTTNIYYYVFICQTEKKRIVLKYLYLLYECQSVDVRDGGRRVGHRTHQSHASCQSSGGPRGEVLLVGGARFSQMNMDVDQT